MLLTAFIAAIFHEITVGALFQFYVINFCGAAISTTHVCPRE
jgi:hypothetical protein